MLRCCRLLFSLLVIGVVLPPFACAEVNTAALARVLRGSVNEEGLVDYSGLKSNPQELISYLKSAEEFSEESLKKLSEKDQLAFWINFYNAATLKVILDHYPIQSGLFRNYLYPKNSIRQIRGAWDGIRFSVAGKSLTLDQVEHEIIRPVFRDPRAHLALVCASRGCPYLRREPYEGAQLDSQFQEQAQKFLTRPSSFQLNKKNHVVTLSPLFQWFGKDFVAQFRSAGPMQRSDEEEQAVLNFLARYLPASLATELQNPEYSIDFASYDWSLNDASATGK